MQKLWNLDTHQMWCYTPFPSDQKAIVCKSVFKVKYKSDDFIEKYKARLIAQGFSQVYRLNYMKIFAPTIRRESLKILLAIATMLGMILIQMNVVEVYLENELGQHK